MGLGAGSHSDSKVGILAFEVPMNSSDGRSALLKVFDTEKFGLDR